MRTKALVGQSPRSSTSASSSSRRFGNQEISDHLVTKIVTREINPVNDNNNQSFRIPLFIPLFLLSLMAIASFLFGYQIWYSQN